jgi:hypothetical protein
VIEGVRSKLDELKKSLPPGVELVTTYDRSGLIDRAVENLTGKLFEEFIIVALVCALFLWHVALRAGGDPDPAARHPHRVHRHASPRGSTPTSCHWAASPSPSARWSMRPSS